MQTNTLKILVHLKKCEHSESLDTNKNNTTNSGIIQMTLLFDISLGHNFSRPSAFL